MKVTVCQWDSRPEMFAAQLQALTAHCSATGSELLVLPEMPFDDWLAASNAVDSQRWALSIQRHLESLIRLSDLTSASVFASRPVLDAAGIARNRAFYCNAVDGLVDAHDKAHLPNEDGYWEAQWYQSGASELNVVQAGACRVGLLICSELWFLEHARRYGQQRAQLLCVSRATPSLGDDVWLAAGQTAAVVAGAYCLSSNQYRPEGVLPSMAGNGWVIDPDGTLLATTTAGEPFVTVEIDLEYADAAKLSYPRYLT
ncbi:MAG: carbon-nitrogen hydrolase family protein [Pseudomonadaceae bacterium]|jgi:predicted amidohydrolase|nr:carbon-nitrogen hydrolase family protein [Pseudomonadaceae bacterium]